MSAGLQNLLMQSDVALALTWSQLIPIMIPIVGGIVGLAVYFTKLHNKVETLQKKADELDRKLEKISDYLIQAGIYARKLSDEEKKGGEKKHE